MSQHYFDATVSGNKVTVQIGFDRPLNGYYLVILDESQEDEVLYSNLFESVPHPETLDIFLQRLNEYSIELPSQMIQEVLEDGEKKMGNKRVRHSIHNGEYRREVL